MGIPQRWQVLILALVGPLAAVCFRLFASRRPPLPVFADAVAGGN